MSLETRPKFTPCNLFYQSSALIGKIIFSVAKDQLMIPKRINWKGIPIRELRRKIEMLDAEQKEVGIWKFSLAKRKELELLKREHWHRVSGYRNRRIKFVQGGSPGLKGKK